MSPEEFLKNLKTKQRSPRENISKSFLEPGLKICKHYRRNTAWFRQSAIGIYAPALRYFIKNDAKMDMLVSLTGKVNSDVIKALERTKDEESRKNILLNFGNDSIKKLSGLEMRPDKWEFQHHVLIYLLAKKKLEIRFAITKPYEGSEDEDFFHEKAGYMLFPDGNSLSFIGNFNESRDSIGVHGERLHIFKSTDSKYDEDREYYINDIDLQWNGKDQFTEVHKLNDDTLIKVKKYALSDEEMAREYKKYQQKLKKEEASEEEYDQNWNIPRIPEFYNGNKFELRDHQIEALEKWQEANFKGILAHATGSGKTVTAISGLCKIAENAKTITVIGVPYQSLADQWVDELENFNIKAIKCYESKNNWYLKAQQEIYKFNFKKESESYVVVMVVVNKTLKSDAFQEIIADIDPEEMLFIGDECHRYCKEGGTNNLPNASLRLGLSATPFGDNEEYDELANNELREFFGAECDSFSLRDALRAGSLCPYKYMPKKVYLTDDEYEEYKELQKKIFLVSEDSGPNEKNMGAVSGIARVLGSAANKYNAFEDHVSSQGILGRTIVFCGDGSNEFDDGTNELNENVLKDKDIAHSILQNHKIRSSFFTCNENSKRRREVLNDFTNADIQCLISIRVLDEGIDVPSVENAFLLASSRNRRQFVQRRGRILRKSHNKVYANLYDFICLPPVGEKSSSIVERELERVIEMTQDCDNKDENIVFIKTLISSYDINDDLHIKVKALIDEHEKEIKR